MLNKCADPECSKTFDYTEGRFFRFPQMMNLTALVTNIHAVEHFWRCNQCAKAFTLQYEKGCKVAVGHRHRHPQSGERQRLIRAALGWSGHPLEVAG